MQIERKLKIGFFIAFAALALTAIAPLLTASWTHSLQDARVRSQSLLEQWREILSLMKDAETSQRGFIITGREDFLDSYHSALTYLGDIQRDIKQKLGDNPEARKKFDVLSQLIQLKLDELAQTIELRRSMGFKAAEPVVSSARGKRYMDQIRDIVEDFAGAEGARQVMMQRELKDRVLIIALIGFTAILLSIVMLMVALRVVFRLLREREQAGEALRKSSEDLSAGLNELERRNAEISLVGQMARALEAPISVKESFEIISFYCAQLLPHTAGQLYLFRNSRDLLEKEAEWGRPPHPAQVIGPQDCWALRRGQPHKVTEASDLICPHYNPSGGRRNDCFCIPLTAQGEVLGLICIESETGADLEKYLLRQKEEALAIAIAEQIALTLSNLSLREVLRQQSIVDPLTGLFNRRYMDETLRREISRAARTSSALSVIVLDIDHFKKVNDTFGHDAGDAVLRALSFCVRAAVRESDLVCRLGGEELILIMPECDREAAVAKANKINAEIRQLDIKHGPQTIGRVTASLGVATFPEDGDHPELLVKAADRAMYLAKKTGRNRVMMAHAAADSYLMRGE